MSERWIKIATQRNLFREKAWRCSFDVKERSHVVFLRVVLKEALLEEAAGRYHE